MIGRLRNGRDSGKALAVVTGCTAISDPGMIHYPRYKSSRIVAGRTGRAGWQMICRFGGRAYPGRKARSGRMTYRAIVRCNLVRWKSRLGKRRNTRKNLPIVALGAPVDDTTVGHPCARERDEIAARVARFAATVSG